ncbi:hypothetical protein ACFTWH_01310 [Streptomyces sp. NPDC057011]|uniref:LppU/SCO3897 family protein n=1 Tax=unclassified Streptomyces TaxID=2593676 RepID=UPI00362660B3
MSSQELDLTITPDQATYGVILTVTLPTGPARLRIPSGTRDGELVRARVGGQEVLARIRVAGASSPSAPAPAPTPSPFLGQTQPQTQVQSQVPGWPPAGAAGPPQPGQPAKKGAAGCLVGVGLVVAVIVGLVVIGSGGDTDHKNSASSTSSPSASSYSPSPYPSYSSSYSAPSYSPSYRSTPAATQPATTEAAPAPSPYDKGTCLNGTLPDSETAQRVDDVDEVSCSASDAHYRVIASIPMTSDMNRCDDYPKTEYAFSHRYTLNGAVINQYVYCLVGIGSYSRG